MKFRSAAVLLCAALTLSLAAPARAFSDVPSGHWAQPKIQAAQEYGLMRGYPDGRFGLNDYIDRASFVTVLCQMFHWEPQSGGAPSYADCGPDHWAYGFVETARAHGVADGALFRPNDPISREEMAIMLVRALGYRTLAESLESAPTPFADVKRNAGYLSLAHQIGMVSGIPAGDRLLFNPSGSATRAEAATMLVQVYERYTSPLDFVHCFYAVSSYSQINLTRDADAVSLGWAQMELRDGLPYVNTTRENGNHWTVPQSPQAATDFFRKNGTPYNLCVYGSPAVGDALSAAQPEVRTQAAKLLAEAAEGYSGLTLDFEGLKEPRRDQFSAFVREVRAALPASQPLYICVQPGPWSTGYDFRALGEICDKVILMAHDYRWASIPESYVGTARTDCPVTPFSKIYAALTEITDPETGVADRSKIALALSMDTTGFKIDENGLLLDNRFYRPSIETLTRRLAQPDTTVTYSERYRNPYAVYTDEQGDRYKVWYENAQSVTDKLMLARMFGINGVSLWRLGNVPGDIWSAVMDLT